ncbi:MAG TPA: cytochrome C, partial [Lacipirellulaceae bacterium]|nr:cytochrome C [Lacipirellulaceae bacterium]
MKRVTCVTLSLFIAAFNLTVVHGAGTADSAIPKTAAAAPTAKLPASALPLKFIEHEHIALVGNSLAERMNLYGNFETLLHTRLPKLELVVRNFARPCDAVDDRQRPNDYTALDDPLKIFAPDTFLCFFGFNEAFAGKNG